MRRLLAAALVLSAVLLPTVPAASAVTAEPADTLTVTGYDFVTERAVPVTAGDADNRLVFSLVVAAPVTDGRLTIDLPTAAWRTPLVALAPATSLHPDDVGAVAVRPVDESFADPEFDCTGPGGDDPTWSVAAAPGVRRIVVDHLVCPAGGDLQVRVNGVRAPRPGRYAFPVRLTDAADVRVATRLPLTVVPAARDRLALRLSAPPYVADRPLAAAVLALRPNGSVDRDYRGSVAFAQDDLDFCGFVAEPGRTFTFTADDAGVLALSLTFSDLAVDGASHTMTVRALDRSARPATSAPYVLQASSAPGANTCQPVSFH